MDAMAILQTISLAVSGWTLLQVIQQGKELTAIKTRLDIQDHEK